MSWNYRVYLCASPPESHAPEHWFEIRETYYEPFGCTDRAVGVMGDDLRWTLARMSEALSKPILDAETFEEIGSYDDVCQRFGMLRDA